MPYRFDFAPKDDLQELLPRLFEILYSNMAPVSPTGNTYRSDLTEWYENVFPAMQKEPRRIVLIRDSDELIGYFQYYTTPSSFMMEEIQIRAEHQGSGVFGELYRWLLPQLPGGLSTVEAYALKENLKSQSILSHLGLSPCGESKNGNCLYYKGEYARLCKKYC